MMNENATRSRWIAGSTCEIFSGTLNKWCRGEIVQIFTDDEGEWLELRYNEYVRELPRNSCSLRPYISVSDEKDEEEKTNNIDTFQHLNGDNNTTNQNNDAIIFTMAELLSELGQMFQSEKIQNLTTKLQQQTNELKQEQTLTDPGDPVTVDTSPTLDATTWLKTQSQGHRDSVPLPYITTCDGVYRQCLDCNIELCVTGTDSKKCLIATYRSNKLEYYCKHCLSLSQYKHWFSLTKLIYESIFRQNIYEVNIINVITYYLYDNVIKCENNIKFWNCSKTIRIEKNIEKQTTEFGDFESCIIQNKSVIICNHCHHDKEDIY
eukprot:465837_1